ncbi:D-2-hydroxyacid dehydrogenase [Paenibacillus sp. GCM10027626]|uniref:D-2-hydroxyacid dehydrogenase n=1 Tax=Paenibacillus sp. GCM10027626 TaxID=3273411 RepID=UPI0036318F32
MNIVVLDGYTLNPGDLSWEQLETLGQLTVYERTEEEQIVERAAAAEIILTNKTPLSAETISRLPKLKYIGVLATGYNIVDIDAAAKRDIVVTNVPSYSTNSVVQLVFALLLQLCQRPSEHSAAVHGGQWAACPDFTFSLFPLVELSGKTMGIIGYGEIGQRVAKVALAFGMKIIVHTRTPKAIAGLEQVHFVAKEELFTEADVVTLHCPLTAETEGIINRQTIGLMKVSAFIINTARGGHVVEQELAAALHEGKLAGAAVDVLSTEPPAKNNPLIGAPNCIITPHIAWATIEARRRLMQIAAANVQSFLRNQPNNQVN